MGTPQFGGGAREGGAMWNLATFMTSGLLPWMMKPFQSGAANMGAEIKLAKNFLDK